MPCGDMNVSFTDALIKWFSTTFPCLQIVLNLYLFHALPEEVQAVNVSANEFIPGNNFVLCSAQSKEDFWTSHRESCGVHGRSIWLAAYLSTSVMHRAIVPCDSMAFLF